MGVGVEDFLEELAFNRSWVKWEFLPTSIAVIQFISNDSIDAISELLKNERKCF